MGTMVAAAPLLAGGPPGWVLYGLVGVGTLAVGAFVVYRASRHADRTFPDTAPSPVQPCPRPAEGPRSQSQPRIDPFPIPRVDDQPQRRNCATEHPDIVLCSSLPTSTCSRPCRWHFERSATLPKTAEKLSELRKQDPLIVARVWELETTPESGKVAHT
jgi:hypothetical protein